MSRRSGAELYEEFHRGAVYDLVARRENARALGDPGMVLEAETALDGLIAARVAAGSTPVCEYTLVAGGMVRYAELQSLVMQN